MTILTWVVTLLTCMLGGMGVGGGGLLMLWFLFVLKMPQLQAQGINLLLFPVSIAGSVLCGTIYDKLRNSHTLRPDFRAVFRTAGWVVLGSILGTFVARHLPTVWLRKSFGIFLGILGISRLFSQKKSKSSPSAQNQNPAKKR